MSEFKLGRHTEASLAPDTGQRINGQRVPKRRAPPGLADDVVSFIVDARGNRLRPRQIRAKAIGLSEQRMRRNRNNPVYYDVYDSGLEWGNYSFESAFRNVIPDGHYETISDQPELSVVGSYIEKALSPKRGEAVGLELGGPGVTLFKSFSPGFFRKTAGLCFKDTQNSPPYIEQGSNHDILYGNMLSEGKARVSDGKQAVRTWHDGKIDLLVERVAGPILDFPLEPFFMAQEAGYWYDQLAPGGLWFAQVPHAFDHTLQMWDRFVHRAQYRKHIDVTIEHHTDRSSVVRIQKLTDTPLPLLPTQSVLRNQAKKGNYLGSDHTWYQI